MEKKSRVEIIDKIPLSVAEGTTEETIEEIIDVLKSTKFNKISVALSSYRSLYDSTVSEDDTRINTIGYIKKFNAAEKTFTVVLFGNNAKSITDKYAKDNLMVEAVYTTYKEKLGVITKLMLRPIK